MKPVVHAAKEGHREVFDLLVREGANLSLLDDDDKNILHLACIGGNVEIVKHVLARKMWDIDTRDNDGWTPVLHAANNGHKDVFDALVEAGADLSLVDGDKETILHLACDGGNVEIIKYLLTQDIGDIGNRDIYGLTLVIHAAYNGDKDVFDILVEAGGAVSQVGYNEETILHLSCEGENVEIIKYLLAHENVDIDSRDGGGWTPVMQVAMVECDDVFDLLVKWGADLSLLDEDNNNILHLACGGNSIEIVRYLLTHDIVDINSRDGEGDTPAMIAACEGHEDVFFLLVDHEADLTIINDAGDNILDMACEGGNVHIVKYVSTRSIAEGPYMEGNPC
ncbi:putative ankyrin repeat protein RF_0381 [Haliotis rubra]|uniref:putative ankyrin repeat protein RF_0381 n=1 Tax=Haliotis rubra TaxID=36100 RepID=UPI001EE521D2|nr:putative ankyrin repeat protein RF_0381 [Haliotis rubra]